MGESGYEMATVVVCHLLYWGFGKEGRQQDMLGKAQAWGVLAAGWPWQPMEFVHGHIVDRGQVVHGTSSNTGNQPQKHTTIKHTTIEMPKMGKTVHEKSRGNTEV